MIAVPYFLLFSFCYLSFLCNTGRRRKNALSFSLKYFCIIYFIIFIGLRGFVSTDWYNYYPFYNNLQEWRSIDLNYLGSFGWEIGTPLMMFLIKKLGVDYFGFCFISAFIDIFVITRFLSKYSKNFYLSLLIFILFGGLSIEFNLIRNTKSIDLFLISIDYIDKKRWKFFILNLVGWFFHFSSIFYVLFFFIYQCNFLKYKKIIFFLWIVGILIYVLKIQYVNLFLNSIADYLPGRIGWIIKRYTVFNDNLQSYGLGFGFIERCISFIFVYKMQDKLILENRFNRCFLCLIYLYLFIFIYFAEIFELVSRLTTLASIAYWILYPALYDILGKREKKYFLIIFTLYSIIKIYAVFGTDLSFEYENILLGAQSYTERVQNNLKYRL